MILQNKVTRDDPGVAMTARRPRRGRLPAIVLMLVTLVTSGAAYGDASDAWLIDGSVGGVLSAWLANDQAQSVRCRVAVPSRYVVISADFTMGRGIVIVAEPRGDGRRPRDTIYEIWLFRRRNAAHTEITFDDREVIYSSATAASAPPGEPNFFISFSVWARPCEGLTAVHFGGSFAGGVLLFTSCGAPAPFDAGRIATMLGAPPQDVVPLAWSHIGDRFCLTLQVTPASGAPRLMTFEPDTGDFAMLPMATLDESTLNELFWAASAQRH